MAKKKANRLVIDDDEEWDELIEEEEDDDIIDDDDDLFDDEDDQEIRHTGQKNQKSRKGSSKKGRKENRVERKQILSHPVVKWTVRTIITIAVVFMLFAPVYPFVELREATGMDSLKNMMRPYRTFPEWVNVTMELSYDLTIRNGQAQYVDIQVATPFDIPLDDPTREKVLQDVKSVSMIPEPTEGTSDFNIEKNFLSGWKLNNVNPGPYQFKVVYNLHLHTFEWNLDEEDSGTVDDIPQEYKDKYLGDEWPRLKEGKIVDDNGDGIPDNFRYNPNDERLNSIAHKLTDDQPTVLGKVKAIYEWIVDNFNYTTNEQRIRDRQVYGDMPKWATGCLNDWYGDCDDQSLLMSSLCRAVGIPAWLEIGYLYDQLKDEWGGHGWFNVIIPRTGGLEPVIAPIDPVNKEFLFRDPFRITDWVDNGSYIIKENGDALYNLDDYYNFYSSRKSPVVDIDLETTFTSISYEEHGSIKKYVDQKIEPGNLQGTEQGIPDLPMINPLIVIPSILFLIAIPARKILLKRV